MESEDLFAETPDYAEELEAMDEPDNYAEIDETEPNEKENDFDEELAEKTGAADLNEGLLKYSVFGGDHLTMPFVSRLRWSWSKVQRDAVVAFATQSNQSLDEVGPRLWTC